MFRVHCDSDGTHGTPVVHPIPMSRSQSLDDESDEDLPVSVVRERRSLNVPISPEDTDTVAADNRSATTIKELREQVRVLKSQLAKSKKSTTSSKKKKVINVSTVAQTKKE